MPPITILRSYCFVAGATFNESPYIVPNSASCTDLAFANKPNLIVKNGIFLSLHVRPPLVVLLFIVFFYCLCEYATHSNYYLFYFQLLYLMEKWSCKQVYWDPNSFLLAPFEPCEKKKYLSVTSCSCAINIHYTSSILVKIMNLSLLFYHMVTL